MRFVVYTCEDCREPVTVDSDSEGRLAQSATCPKCGGVAASKAVRGGRNASTGEIRSANLGCGIGQEADGNRVLAENNIDAHYEDDGTLVAANRQAFQEVQASRGMMSHTDGGGYSRKISRIRERSLAGNPHVRR